MATPDGKFAVVAPPPLWTLGCAASSLLQIADILWAKSFLSFAIAVVLVMFAIGAWQLHQRLHLGRSAIIAAAAFAVALTKIAGLIIHGDSHLAHLAATAIRYGYDGAWLLLAIMLASLAWQQTALRGYAFAVIVVTVFAKPFPFLENHLAPLGGVFSGEGGYLTSWVYGVSQLSLCGLLLSLAGGVLAMRRR